MNRTCIWRSHLPGMREKTGMSPSAASSPTGTGMSSAAAGTAGKRAGMPQPMPKSRPSATPAGQGGAGAWMTASCMSRWSPVPCAPAPSSTRGYRGWFSVPGKKTRAPAAASWICSRRTFITGRASMQASAKKKAERLFSVFLRIGGRKKPTKSSGRSFFYALTVPSGLKRGRFARTMMSSRSAAAPSASTAILPAMMPPA